MRISVIIPVYNAEKYVTQAVESALKHDVVFEILLIEDKSPDESLIICQELAATHDRIKLFQHPDKENHGAGASRNLGIEKCSGDFIAFLDADDYYLPNRFDAERNLFNNPNVEGVYGAIGVQYYSTKAEKQYYKVFGNRLTTVYREHNPKDVFPGLINMRGSFGLFSLDGLTIRKDSLKKMNSFFKTELRLHQDTEFIFRLSYYLDLYPGIIDQAVAMRGVHENNRITKVDSNKNKPAISRSLLWNEVHNWAKIEKNIPENVKIHIKRTQRSFEIANASKLKKWAMVIKYLFLDHQSIKSGLYNINFRYSLIS